MSLDSGKVELIDAPERERAATTFDRNVVVTAGAGTGKTTLLVDRLVHLLMRHPEPLRVTEVVALTFTNKAANEMKLRLRERLQAYLGVRLNRKPGTPDEERIQQEVRSLIARYHLTKDGIDQNARKALSNIERSEIGTIHSFAATLLRLYPLESGLDPQFQEDEGGGFDRLFEESWSLWLDRELSAESARSDQWKAILRKTPLQEVRELAHKVCSEMIDLRRLSVLTKDGAVPEILRSWIEGLGREAEALISAHPGERTNERLLRAAGATIGEFSAGKGLDTPWEAKNFLLSGKSLSRRIKGWEAADLDRAERIVRVARRICQIDPNLSRQVAEILIPFAEEFRESFVRCGLVSFDALLVRARNLLRDFPAVREELKRQYRAILIDEFQDTDPIQYEILLYLAEQAGREAKEWTEVKLTPGKLFIVGDPKQSIYSFRRADIEGYLGVVRMIVREQYGVECSLSANFRSHCGILDVVNGVFERLIRPREGVQAAYGRIRPPSPEQESGGDGGGSAAFREVVLREVTSEEEESDAETGRRLEAESLARWLQEEVLGKALVRHPGQKPAPVRPGDVAILFRSLTQVHHYLGALRRQGIRYVVEGERHFYAVQEIVDAVNLLRVVENPHDRAALVGFLRSPFVGLSDLEIYELHRQDLLYYGAVSRIRKIRSRKLKRLLLELYPTLQRLHEESRRLPVGEAVAEVFRTLSVRPLAAHSFNGEQAVANLEKVRQQTERLGREGLMTLKEAIAMLQRWVWEGKEEGESALAEENIDAVRVLSIHRAKGLEFPVVILAGCHMGVEISDSETTVEQDWSTRLIGMKIGSSWDLPGIFLAEKRKLREIEEQKRVLYVAMTRAREHLTISCAPIGRTSRGSFLSLLEGVVAGLASREKSGRVAAGEGKIEVRVVREKLLAPGSSRAKIRGPSELPDWDSLVSSWEKLGRDYEALREKPLFVSPAFLKRREAELSEAWGDRVRVRVSSADSFLIGELAHRFLERWEFTSLPDTYERKLAEFLDSSLQGEPENGQSHIRKELEKIFSTFFSSPIYQELMTVKILGREIPLLISWEDQIMEGVMDLLYEKEGKLYIADYKTDRISRDGLSGVVESYRHQVEIYTAAARRVLQREVRGFKLLFLRLGEVVEALGVRS